jgi:hypothetical protein
LWILPPHVKLSAVAIDPEMRLVDTEETSRGLSLHLPISGLLDALVIRANEAGAATSRKELIGALILGAPRDAEDLAQLVMRHRTLRSGAAIVEGIDERLVLDPDALPGRRSGRSGVGAPGSRRRRGV